MADLIANSVVRLNSDLRRVPLRTQEVFSCSGFGEVDSFVHAERRLYMDGVGCVYQAQLFTKLPFRLRQSPCHYGPEWILKFFLSSPPPSCVFLAEKDP